MRSKALLLAGMALALLLWRRRTSRHRKGSMSPGERPDWRYAIEKLRGIVSPPVEITPPPPGIRFEHDVEVEVRDGTILRVNVFRPEGDGSYPVIMCTHPYVKDRLPERGPFGYRPLPQYRMLRQPKPLTFSAWTSWEAPDPAYWVPRGYAVVNCDLRGFGTSEGHGNLLTDAEARDIYDLIEWAGTQPWSNGKVGMNGVSYLAISQYKVAALRPPHLAAICPWEGLSDVYRDFARPGGIREDGFIRVWSAGVKRGGQPSEDVREEQIARPLLDEWWRARTPELERIEVPMLVCGSFSDQQLHSRGSFRAFERVSSPQRWLYTHRGGKWAEYYSEEALAFQRRFFDHFLKGEENGMLEVPPVRLEVREDRDTVHEVRFEEAWSLPQTRWTDLHLRADGHLTDTPVNETGVVGFDTSSERASFVWDVSEDMEITGPMALRLFSRPEKPRTCTLRKFDPSCSTPWRPVHTYDEFQPLKPGEVVPVDIALSPSGTYFRKGEQMRLDVQGHWFSTRNPLFGQAPAAYEDGPQGSCLLHCGGEHSARLRIPIIAPRASS